MSSETNLYCLGQNCPQLPASGNFWMAPNACVIGNVILGEGASIWFGSILRADNEPIHIGDGSNIQECCVLHVDPGYPINIGRNCTIGHKTMLHGCTIGDNTLIGMGATVLNGAEIGNNCLIGAGALITENTVIPDGSLAVGMPAKVKRALSEDQISGLRRTAEKYQWNKDQFKANLNPVSAEVCQCPHLER